MATTTMEKELLALEREYWDSMITKDPTVATRLTADESIVVGAHGVGTVTSKNIGSMVQTDDWKLKRYEFSDVACLPIDDNNAIIAYRVKEELEVDGKPVSFTAHDATVWTKRKGKWVSTLHTESVAGDAYGRDKQPQGRNN